MPEPYYIGSTEFIIVDRPCDLPSHTTFIGVLAKTDEIALDTFRQRHDYEPEKCYVYENSMCKSYYFEVIEEKE